MNLYNVWYTEGQCPSEKKTYWRSSLETVDEVTVEIQLKHGWTVVFIERLK